MQGSARQLYLRLLRHVVPYWRIFGLSLIAMVVLAATEPAIPALLQKVVSGFENRDISAVPLMAGLFVALFAIRGAAAFGSSVALAAVAGRLVLDLRSAMFDKLTSLPTRFYDQHNTGTLASKMTFDATQVMEASTHVVTVLVRDTLAIGGLFAWMLYLNWQLTLVAVAAAPIVVCVVLYFSRRLRRMSQRLQETMGEVTHVSLEVVEGQKVIRTFGAQSHERKRFVDTVNRARRFQVKFAAAAAGNAPIAQLVTAVALAAILMISAEQFEAGNMSLADFVSFFTAMGMLFSPLKRLTSINGRLQKGIAAAGSVFGLIDESSEPDRGTREIERAIGRIALHSVGFRYEEDGPQALHDIDLIIEPGETLALVGPSGSGKSTLVNLIPRFYETSVGAILLDGIDTRELRLDSLRRNIALVSQEVVLFNDSVAANIAYGHDPREHHEAIVRAAGAAYATDFIDGLAAGLDTPIGERGVRLSGGQRQRLAIARAFFKDAPVLILDEATSALDTESERHIQAALERLRAGRTTLVIAHRLSSIEQADRIAVMKDGQIVDVGTHGELLERNPLYAALYRFQFARRQEGAPEREAHPFP